MHSRIHLGPLALALLIVPAMASSQTPVINEFMSDNATTLADGDGEFSDWIELYNPGSAPFDLTGCYLSDDPDDPLRWRFPASSVPAGGFLVVWASGKDDQGPAGELHTSFAIDAAGEVLLLTAADGVAGLDQAPAVALETDISHGRAPDGASTWQDFAGATPGATNDAGLPYLEAPTFSVEPGFFSADVQLALAVDDPQALITYTLDGSEPTAASTRYQGILQLGSRAGDPDVYALIPTNFRDALEHHGWRPPRDEVFKVNVVRARAFRDGHAPSRIVTGTYVVAPDLADQVPLPVLSVATQPASFFADDIGIYVPGDTYEPGNLWTGNYFQRGDDWERPVHIELFEQDGQRILAQDAGVRMHGNYTRHFPQKTLRFAARSEYGDGDFDCVIFPDLPHGSYDRFLARNIGNDWGKVGFRDLVFHAMVAGMGFDVQAGRPVVHFINGEYWGLTNLRERIDRHYIERHHEVPEEAIALLYGNATLEEGEPGDRADYLALRDHVSTVDMTQPDALAEVSEQMDLQNFIAYMVAEIYSCNSDWPGNNIRFWRRTRDAYNPEAPPGHDGRWRWILYDVDHAFSTASFNSLAHATATDGPDWPNPPWSTALLRGLLENPDFEREFINTFADHLNSTFVPARLTHIIDTFATRYRPAIAAWQDRWDVNDTFDSGVQAYRNFTIYRPDHQRAHIRDHFDLPGETTVALDVNDPAMGHVQINSLLIDADLPGLADPTRPYPWSGVYFRTIPITAVAHPAPGHRFVEWVGHEAGNAQVTLTPGSAPISLTAVFAVDEDAPRTLHAWHFNDLPDDVELTTVVADSSLLGTAAITYPGTGDGYLDRVEDGTLLGGLPGVPAGAALRVRNPSHTRELIITTPSTSHEDLVLRYAVKRTTNGAENHSVAVRIGPEAPWQTVATDVPVTEDYQLLTHDLASIAGVADNPDLTLRFTFGGGNAPGGSGNQRLDNLALEGTRIPGANLPPAVSGPVALQQPVAGGPAVTIDLATVFTDPDDDALTHAVASERPAVATATVNGQTLTIAPVSRGDTRVTILASDGHHAPTPHTFRVLVHPAAAVLSQTSFSFLAWDPDTPEHTYPAHMLFLQSTVDDPALEEPLLHPYHIDHDDYHDDDQATIGFPYNNTGRTRINGLGADGISFVNTGRGRDLGAAVVALDTRDVAQVQLSWLAGTITPNDRTYAIRLQYRTDPTDSFDDLLIGGAPVEYVRSGTPGDTVEFAPVALPDELVGLPYLQLAWRYHHVDGSSGPRARLRLDDLRVVGGGPVAVDPATVPLATRLHGCAPNPFNPATEIRFAVGADDEASLAVFDSRGQRVRSLGRFTAGQHRVRWDGTDAAGRRCASGVYLVRLDGASGTQAKKVMIVK